MLDHAQDVRRGPPAARRDPADRPPPPQARDGVRPDATARDDALAGQLARAVAGRRGIAAGRGRLLQRSPETAAAALRVVHPTAASLKAPQLTTWLKQRANTSGDDRRTNAQVHDVSAGSLKLINQALAKLTVGTEVKPPKVEVKDEQPTPRRGAKAPEVKTVEFPHGAKHRPAFSNREKIIESTEGGNDARYFSMDPQTVIDLESTALEEGLDLAGGFTTVHRFDVEIGADYGEATQCLRMDGAHHGHPIVEKSTATPSFVTYVSKDLADARFNENVEREKTITEYLVRVGLPASTMENQIKKHMATLLKQWQESELVRKDREQKKAKFKKNPGTDVKGTDTTGTDK
ncbi:MAG: hypothetical protein QOJ46_1910 [bacterium]|jgi:hypothetical protein|nr:hypothetical protein [Thermoleophilaceae bacterium]